MNDSDTLAFRLQMSLISDFQSLLNDSQFASKFAKAVTGGVESFRAYEFPKLGVIPPIRYKCWWQLQNFLKRYQFETDALSQDAIIEQSVRKYTEFDVERSIYSPHRASTKMVLREARRICREILSLPFDVTEFRRFGRRATRNCPLAEAYFDNKLTDGARYSVPVDLLKEHTSFLNSPQIGRFVAKKIDFRSFEYSTSLNLVDVPKTWKAKRLITPLTEFGLYWSYGLGKYVELCLRNYGMDIRKMQKIHASLVKPMSVNLSHVTVDLSNGSGNLRSDILNAVLPRFFYRELRKTFCRTLVINEKEYHTSQVLLMGNNATFPVETLVFYALIKSVGNLTRKSGIYSVYGDDIIYPSKIHTQVMHIFDDLGIKVNGDKTFVHTPFRESCGSDYYQGIDVRPSLFPDDRMPSGRLRKLEYLYKVYNSLLTRWSRFEIPRTLQILYQEICMCNNGRVHYVPKSFPETSGIRVNRIPKGSVHEVLQISKEFVDGSRRFTFECVLPTKPKDRPLRYTQIYYWEKLREYAAEKRIETLFPLNQQISEDKIRQNLLVHKSVSKRVAGLILRSLCMAGSQQDPGKLLLVTSEALHIGGKPKTRRIQVSTWV